MTWKVFDYDSRKGQKGEYVSINQAGVIRLSKAVAHLFHLGQFGFVQLNYDDERKLIGLRFSEDKLVGSTIVKPHHSGVLINARVFIEHLRIKCGRYVVDEWRADQRMLICQYELSEVQS